MCLQLVHHICCVISHLLAPVALTELTQLFDLSIQHGDVLLDHHRELLDLGCRVVKQSSSVEHRVSLDGTAFCRTELTENDSRGRSDVPSLRLLFAQRTEVLAAGPYR